jgi:hypothetical protein
MIMTDMLKDGIIGSTTARGALSLRFPPSEHDLLFPGLFIEAQPFHQCLTSAPMGAVQPPDRERNACGFSKYSWQGRELTEQIKTR